jgi:hypothetical protein
MNLTIVLVMLILLIGSSVQFASGHKPLQVDGSNNDFENAKEIPNHRISWAIYQELSLDNPVHFYTFDAEEGDRLYAQISIPKLERLSDFSPSIALIGSEVTANNLEEGYSVREYAHDIGDLPFSIPLEMSTIVVNYEDEIPSREFYEPFTQTSYWERQEIAFNGLPTDGMYYLVIFDRNHLQNTGKYTLAVGEIEDFSPIDFITIIPSAWLEIKLFFEDYLSPAIAISLLAVIPGTITIFLIKRMKRTRNETNTSPFQ